MGNGQIGEAIVVALGSLFSTLSLTSMWQFSIAFLLLSWGGGGGVTGLIDTGGMDRREQTGE